VVQTATQIIFTQLVTRTITNFRNPTEEFENILTKILNNLKDLSNMLAAQNLTPLQRLALISVLVHEVHNRDVITKLIGTKVEGLGTWEWLGNMRYYWEDDKCLVRMVQSTFEYGYEYLGILLFTATMMVILTIITGNTGRLVATPLTDRVFRSMASALGLNLGAAPMGPAGTGKTETVKDLAKSVAKFCVVFNCSAGLDIRTLAKIFRGVASAGTWVCLFLSSV
jgi:dynein heavy chain, axonemal